MSKKEKRIAICQDVIKQIRANNLKLECGSYVVSPKEKFSYSGKNVSKEDCDTLRESCYVCALGSMLISRIDLYNKITWNDVDFNHGWSYQVMKALRTYFKESQLILIEAAFEIDQIKYSMEVNKSSIEEAILFGKDHDYLDDRLLCIMQNIIDHDGKFVPSVRYRIDFEYQS